MKVDSLPDRPLTFNEKEALAAQAREATSLTGMPIGCPKDEPSIDAFVLITSGKLYALDYTDEWQSVYQAVTPDGAFAGPYITNKDHNHEEVQAAFDALKERSNEY